MPKCDWFFALLCPQSLSKENLGKTFSLTLARNKSWNKKKSSTPAAADTMQQLIGFFPSPHRRLHQWCEIYANRLSDFVLTFFQNFTLPFPFFQSACGGVFRAVVFWDWLTARPRKIEIANQYRTLIRAHRMSITAKKEKRGSRAYTRVMCQS